MHDANTATPTQSGQAYRTYINLAQSYKWWAQAIYRIVPRFGKRQYTPFVFNKIQNSVVSKIQASGRRHVAAVMPRQVGKSTLFTGKAAHTVSISPFQYGLITSYDRPQVKKVIRRMKNNMQASPSVGMIGDVEVPLMPKLMDTDSYEISLCFDFHEANPKEFSRIDAYTAGRGESVGRGEPYDYVLLTEAGLKQYHDYQTYIACYQCLPSNQGLFVMEGTPFGALGPFYDKFMEAYHDPENSEFIAIIEFWTDYAEYQTPLDPGEDPAEWNKHLYASVKPIEPENDFECELVDEYHITLPQLKWARNMVKSGFGRTKGTDPYEYFHQEYPIDPYRCWVVQGSSVFIQEMVVWGAKRAKRSIEEGRDPVTGKRVEEKRYRSIVRDRGLPKLVEDSIGPWRFIEDVERDLQGRPTGVYIVSVDPAEGKPGGDFTVVTILKRTAKGPDRIVGTARLKDPNLWGIARQIAGVALRYNTAYIMPESNGKMGGAICQALMYATDYPDYLIYRMPVDAEIKAKGGLHSEIGWLTTPKNKGPMIENYQDMMWHNWQDPYSDDGIECLFPEYWEECRTYTFEGQSMHGSQGSNDDHVMSAGIGCYGLRYFVPNPNVMEFKPRSLVPGQPVPPMGLNDIFEIEPVERYA